MDSQASNSGESASRFFREALDTLRSWATDEETRRDDPDPMKKLGEKALHLYGLDPVDAQTFMGWAVDLVDRELAETDTSFARVRREEAFQVGIRSVREGGLHRIPAPSTPPKVTPLEVDWHS